MKSITAIREADNKRLAQEGRPYRYDCAGYMRCVECGDYWQEGHKCHPYANSNSYKARIK